MLWKVAGVGIIIGAFLATVIGNVFWSAKLARSEARYEKELRELSRSTAEQLARAQRATADVTTKFEQYRRATHDTEQRLRQQIARLRAVHVSPEHRVLINEAIAPTHHVPTPTSEPTPRPAGPPPATPAPTGTDNLAEWAVIAASMYRTCQAQIRGLKAWADEVFSHTPPTDESSESTPTPPPHP